jgi:SEC-C motif
MTEKPKGKPRIPPLQRLPPSEGPCPCGSGLKFGRCCAERLPGTAHLGSRTAKFLSADKFEQALEAARADVTQYTIWHRSHTEPAIQMGMPKKGSIFEIDVRALADCVETLMQCHIKAEKSDEFPVVLERLRDNIRDTAWQRKITYFHAIHALGPRWDVVAGRRELERLGPLVEDDDVETAQLYLHLFGDSLSFTEKLTIIDRILSNSKKLSDLLHYKGRELLCILLLGI